MLESNNILGDNDPPIYSFTFTYKMTMVNTRTVKARLWQQRFSRILNENGFPFEYDLECLYPDVGCLMVYFGDIDLKNDYGSYHKLRGVYLKFNVRGISNHVIEFDLPLLFRSVFSKEEVLGKYVFSHCSTGGILNEGKNLCLPDDISRLDHELRTGGYHLFENLIFSYYNLLSYENKEGAFMSIERLPSPFKPVDINFFDDNDINECIKHLHDFPLEIDVKISIDYNKYMVINRHEISEYLSKHLPSYNVYKISSGQYTSHEEVQNAENIIEEKHIRTHGYFQFNNKEIPILEKQLPIDRNKIPQKSVFNPSLLIQIINRIENEINKPENVEEFEEWFFSEQISGDQRISNLPVKYQSEINYFKENPTPNSLVT